ncbi:MAG: class I SAM-dependent methyltransferase [Patescibacteria group bacterium]
MNTDAVTKLVERGYSQDKIVGDYSKNRNVWPEEKAIFDKYFKKIGKVLDIGCGAGRTTFYLAKLDNKVVGIDISEKFIEKAKERLKEEPADIEFKVGDANKLAYPDSSFSGAVFSFNGIGFIPRKEGKIKFINEVNRVLKSGGYLFFTAHNPFLINRFIFGNLMHRTRILFSKAFGMKIQEQECGEKYNDKPNEESPYIDIKGRRTWLNIIRQSDMELEYFNSMDGIKENRNFSFPQDLFGKKNFFFFVLKKPGR